MSSFRERRSWATLLSQELDRSDAFYITKKTSNSKTTRYTSGHLIPRMTFEKRQFLRLLILFSSDFRPGRRALVGEPTWASSSTVFSAVRGNSRVYKLFNNSETITIITAEHFHFLMQTQYLPPLADPRVPSPSRAYYEQATR